MNNRKKTIKKYKDFLVENSGNILLIIGFILMGIGIYLFNLILSILYSGALFIYIGYIINKNK